MGSFDPILKGIAAAALVGLLVGSFLAMVAAPILIVMKALH